jgi:hypothetical protein
LRTSTDLLHATINYQQRPRILSTESSTAGASLVGTALALLWLQSKSFKWLIPMAVVVILSVDRLASRGTTNGLIVAVVIAVALGVIGGFLRRSAGNRKIIAGLITVGAVLAFTAGSSVLRAVYDPVLQTAGSDATRSAWSFVGMRALIDRPWGDGYSAPLLDLPAWLSEAIEALQAYYPPSAWTELAALVGASTDEALAPKTLPASAAVYLGLPGMLLAISLLFTLAGAAVILSATGLRNHGAAAVAPLFTIVAITTYTSSIYDVSLMVLIGFATCSGDKAVSQAPNGPVSDAQPGLMFAEGKRALPSRRQSNEAV